MVPAKKAKLHETVSIRSKGNKNAFRRKTWIKKHTNTSKNRIQQPNYRRLTRTSKRWGIWGTKCLPFPLAEPSHLPPRWRLTHGFSSYTIWNLQHCSISGIWTLLSKFHFASSSVEKSFDWYILHTTGTISFVTSKTTTHSEQMHTSGLGFAVAT